MPFFNNLALSIFILLCTNQFVQAIATELSVGDPIALDKQEKILREDIVLIPSKEDRFEFLKTENLIFNYQKDQHDTGEGIEPIFGLSIDGGGIRGIIPAIWLNMLQKEVNAQIFDCVGGASIGGILALGVASGIKPDKLVDLFAIKGGDIFPPIISKSWLSFTGPVVNLWSLAKTSWSSKYPTIPLENILKDTLGAEKDLKSLKTKILIPTCTTMGKPRLFENFSNSKIDTRCKLWEIGRCTSAAPTYFPAFSLSFPNSVGTLNPSKILTPSIEPEKYVDGGMWINNPSFLVTSRIVKYMHGGSFAPENIYMLSLGTGSTKINLSQNSGLLHARSIIDVLIDSNSEGTDETMEMILNKNYYRINFDLPKKIDLADATKENIELLKSFTDENSKLYGEFAKKAKKEIKKFVTTFRKIKFPELQEENLD
jgi:patatin-like phospholipase/acyl hydrolase